ncbi:hypothetical protein TPHA_0M01110 [Tetrapisispora phaffii CBS 4417]|uniref:Uncharacterized protein n=1 Tax=Tetrapisispora phaffii (strain ATCC 24235 / CBS 4417 / NBRC 1672 / NRRL Y-8282 / UCD 70-5) TaxID=1071381 RepID=G8C0H1_TETPH|nr:hypothetical protein TPHA_0M01110 [Tetrapisispora phaffii CBS 4417]CCE65686.1 hypothetical protein TPHA_0M01110 [Tetrapisispora phaffii CBS 4417]
MSQDTKNTSSMKDKTTPASSMNYVETIKERKVHEGIHETWQSRLEEFSESLYWAYYIHLPYYLMTSFDSFCLHVFFLVDIELKSIWYL